MCYDCAPVQLDLQFCQMLGACKGSIFDDFNVVVSEVTEINKNVMVTI